jgi:hypothetical protein
MVNNIQNIIKKHNDMVATIRADLLAIAKQHPDLAEQVKSVLNTTLQNGSFFEAYRSFAIAAQPFIK